MKLVQLRTDRIVDFADITKNISIPPGTAQAESTVDINMVGKEVIGLPAIPVATGAASKEYADTKLARTGGEITGAVKYVDAGQVDSVMTSSEETNVLDQPWFAMNGARYVVDDIVGTKTAITRAGSGTTGNTDVTSCLKVGSSGDRAGPFGRSGTAVALLEAGPTGGDWSMTCVVRASSGDGFIFGNIEYDGVTGKVFQGIYGKGGRKIYIAYLNSAGVPKCVRLPASDLLRTDKIHDISTPEVLLDHIITVTHKGSDDEIQWSVDGSPFSTSLSGPYNQSESAHGPSSGDFSDYAYTSGNAEEGVVMGTFDGFRAPNAYNGYYSNCAIWAGTILSEANKDTLWNNGIGAFDSSISGLSPTAWFKCEDATGDIIVSEITPGSFNLANIDSGSYDFTQFLKTGHNIGFDIWRKLKDSSGTYAAVIEFSDWSLETRIKGEEVHISINEVDVLTINSNGLVMGTDTVIDAKSVTLAGGGSSPGAIESTTNTATQADFYMAGVGLMIADNDIYFAIDKDGNSSTDKFRWGHDGGVTGGSIVELMTLGENGILDLAGEIKINGNLNHDGSNVGFYGATPVTVGEITGDLGNVIDGNVKDILTSIIAKLVALGLMTNGTI